MKSFFLTILFVVSLAINVFSQEKRTSGYRPKLVTITPIDVNRRQQAPKNSSSSSEQNQTVQYPVSPKSNPNISEACDKISFTPASSKPKIESFLKGVKYAVIPEPKTNTQIPLMKALSNYVFDLGLIKVSSKAEISNYDLSQVAFIEVTNNFEYKIGINNKIFNKCYDIKIYFTSPKFSYEWVFSTNQETLAITDQELETQYYKCLQDAYNNKSRGTFNSAFTLKPLLVCILFTDACR